MAQIDNEIKLNGTVYVKKTISSTLPQEFETVQKHYWELHTAKKELEAKNKELETKCADQKQSIKRLEVFTTNQRNTIVMLEEGLETARARADKYEGCYNYFSLIRKAIATIEELEQLSPKQ